MPTNLWPTIHAERWALADDLEGITDEQWELPSLCHDWSVRDVLAHLTGTASTTFPAFVGRIVRSGFSLQRMFARVIEENSLGPPAETLARFRAKITSTTAPVPGPKEGWLGETIVHAEDIRRPLGIAHTYPPDALHRLSRFYRKMNLDGSKKRSRGLTLRATDADWSTGEGPEVTGPGIALVQAQTGRVAALDRLSGDGIITLKERL